MGFSILVTGRHGEAMVGGGEATVPGLDGRRTAMVEVLVSPITDGAVELRNAIGEGVALSWGGVERDLTHS